MHFPVQLRLNGEELFPHLVRRCPPPGHEVAFVLAAVVGEPEELEYSGSVIRAAIESSSKNGLNF
jgi:hypothetical protein